MVQSIKFDNRVTNCHRSHVNMCIERLECRFHKVLTAALSNVTTQVLEVVESFDRNGRFFFAK